MGDELARVKQLRDCFQRAKERLEALPETGLSDDGQPYIREVAEALQSFAGWFCNLTLDDMSLSGSARRVHVALNGVDAIADWVGLHRSQQFATDIREHVSELFEQSEALDDAVIAAFTVKRTPARMVLSRERHITQAKRDAIEDGIQSVSSLAGSLGVRLQRIALMTGSRSTKASGSTKQTGGKQPKRRGRKNEGRPGYFPRTFVREVVTARERDEKHAAKARKPLPSISEWLSDYFTNVKKLPLSAVPSKDPNKPEEWSIRAKRFWKAARQRLSRPGN